VDRVVFHLEREESFLSRWLDRLRALFLGETATPSDRRLTELAAEAEKASPGSRWAVFNRLGDAYLKAGDRARALKYFGKAIDALLEDDQPEPARAVAKKVVRLHPEAVRTHCTLTWLDLASLKLPAATRSLQEYAMASRRGKRETFACGQILEMARMVSDPGFLVEASRALADLGCETDSAQARAWAESGGSPDAPRDRRTLYISCLKAAAGSNVQLKTDGSLA
jgi:hypothetical protein